jgi:two-component system sensor histidine kinase QseC
MGGGLGLAIAELAARRLNGIVLLYSRPEGGLRAELRISIK